MTSFPDEPERASWLLVRPGARRLEKDGLALIHTLLAVWVFNLVGLAVFFHQDNRVASNCLSAAAAWVVLTGLFLEFRHRWQHKSTIAWMAVAPLVLAQAVFLAGAVWAVYAPGHIFAVDKYALYQVDDFPDGTPRFAAVTDPLPDGQVFVSPIDALLLLQIRNVTAEPRRIQSYKIDGLIGGVWEPLCRVKFSPNSPYYLSARASAREVVLTPLALGADAETIAPGGAKTFWSGWACPRKCDLANARLRITLTGTNARREVIPFPAQGKAGTFEISAGLGIGGAVALDPAREEIYDRGVCAARGRHTEALW